MLSSFSSTKCSQSHKFNQEEKWNPLPLSLFTQKPRKITTNLTSNKLNGIKINISPSFVALKIIYDCTFKWFFYPAIEAVVP
jgi:hypothetical protein